MYCICADCLENLFQLRKTVKNTPVYNLRAPPSNLFHFKAYKKEEWEKEELEKGSIGEKGGRGRGDGSRQSASTGPLLYALAHVHFLYKFIIILCLNFNRQKI